MIVVLNALLACLRECGETVRVPVHGLHEDGVFDAVVSILRSNTYDWAKLNELYQAVERDYGVTPGTSGYYGINNNKVDSRGMTLFHWAALLENDDALLRILPPDSRQVLTEAGRVLVNRRDGQGRTPIYIASEYGGEQFVLRLLNIGADFCIQSNNEGLSAFQVCVSKGGSAVFESYRRHFNDRSEISEERLHDILNQRSGANGDTALHLAAHRGYLPSPDPDERMEFVSRLIALGAERNVVNSKGNTPLHVALQVQKMEVVELLLPGTEVIVNAAKVTPLGCAAQTGDIRFVDTFISHQEGTEQQASEISCALFWASMFGKGDMIDILLERGASYYSTPFPNGRKRNCVAVAFANGHTQVLRQLLNNNQKAGLVEPGNEKSSSIAELVKDRERKALGCGRGEDRDRYIAGMLEDFGVMYQHYKDQGLVRPMLFMIKSSLILVVKNSKNELVPDYLAQLASLQIDDEDKRQVAQVALFIAAQSGAVEAMEILLTDEAYPYCAVDLTVNGKTPLYAAAEAGREASVAYLLGQSARSDILFDGKTPLRIAVIRLHDRVVSAFLATTQAWPRRGVNSCESLSEFATTKRTAQQDKKTKIKKQWAHRYKQRSDYRQTKKSLARLDSIIQSLNTYNLNRRLEREREEDSRLLLRACQLGNLGDVKTLLRSGCFADIEVRNSDHETPLIVAAKAEQVDMEVRYNIVKYLIKKGANFEASSIDEGRLIHICARYGLIKIANYLLTKCRARGLDPYAQDPRGKTAAQLAKSANQRDMQELFQLLNIGEIRPILAREDVRNQSRRSSEQLELEGGGGGGAADFPEEETNLLFVLSQNIGKRQNPLPRTWKEVAYKYLSDEEVDDSNRVAAGIAIIEGKRYTTEEVNCRLATTAGDDVAPHSALPSMGRAVKQQIAVDLYKLFSHFGNYYVAPFNLGYRHASDDGVAAKEVFLISGNRQIYGDLGDLLQCTYCVVDNQTVGGSAIDGALDLDSAAGGGGGGGGAAAIDDDSWSQAPAGDSDEEGNERVKMRGKFVDCINAHCLPTHAIIEGVEVPIIGLIELLAIARVLSDISPLGYWKERISDEFGNKISKTFFEYASYVVERKDGRPIAVRMVKVGSAWPFAFNSRNQLAGLIALKAKCKMLDPKNLQLDGLAAGKLELFWDNLLPSQQDRFCQVVREALGFLNNPANFSIWFSRYGAFKEVFPVDLQKTYGARYSRWLTVVEKNLPSVQSQYRKQQGIPYQPEQHCVVTGYNGLPLAPLLRVWTGKWPQREDMLFHNYVPYGPKASGQECGYMVKDRSNGQLFLAKPRHPDPVVLDTDETVTRIGQKGTYVAGLKEKAGLDAYGYMGEAYHVTVGRLAMLDPSNKFTKAKHMKASLAALTNALKAGGHRASSCLHVLSAWIFDYKSLGSLTGCLRSKDGADEYSFIECLQAEEPFLPAWVRMGGNVLELVGLIELLAAGCVLADRDVLGYKRFNIGSDPAYVCDNAGWVLENGVDGKPARIRVLKLDAGECFSFGKGPNFVEESIRDAIILNSSGGVAAQRLFQFGADEKACFDWSILSQKQQVLFLRSFKSNLDLLTKEAMRVLLFRNGLFLQVPGRALPVMKEEAMQLETQIEEWTEYLALLTHQAGFGRFFSAEGDQEKIVLGGGGAAVDSAAGGGGGAAADSAAGGEIRPNLFKIKGTALCSRSELVGASLALAFESSS